jgi:hypothetical protein
MTNKTKKLSTPVDKKLDKLVGAKNPTIYIDLCVKSNLTTGDKRRATKIWLDKTGYTIKDIEYARNRHPYWKKKKSKNSYERNKQRLNQYDFSNGLSKKWSDKELEKLLDLNDSYKDWQLAKHFNRSIPSIQYIRRCISLAKKILIKQKSAYTKKRVLDLIKHSEKFLSKMIMGNKKN